MIYVASSWRNPRYEGILDCLVQWDIPYYNWRDEEGFHWSEVFNKMKFGDLKPGGIRICQTCGEVTLEDEMHLCKVEHWTSPIPPQHFAQALTHERAQAGFARDMKNLTQADAV